MSVGSAAKKYFTFLAVFLPFAFLNLKNIKNIENIKKYRKELQNINLRKFRITDSSGFEVLKFYKLSIQIAETEGNS